MSLEKVLRIAVERINSGSLTNEAEVKEWVIRPILHELDWNDPAEFRLEFPVDNGRVDYALLGDGNPLVFIEAKGLGLVSSDGEEQVFGYAAHRGVPFLVLTDGNFWDFYLSMAAGVPADRRFYRAELTREERIPEYVEFLDTYLRKDRVVSNDAYHEALERLKSNQEREKARNAIPGSWRTLLETPEEMLRDLLAEEVESQCGTKPDLDDVEDFLKKLLSSDPLPPRSPSATQPSRFSEPKPPKRALPLPRRRNRQSEIIGFILDGERFDARNATDTFAKVLNEFASRDSGFMEHFAERTVGRIRRLVARNRADLYPNRSDLARQSSLRLRNGWWLATNNSTKQKWEYIQIACEVAGVKFGTELELIER